VRRSGKKGDVSCHRKTKDDRESKKSIADGSLSLCAAAALMDHFNRNKKLPIEEKTALLEQVKGKSERECERILNPESLEGESVHFIADEETMADLRRLSELLSIPERDMSVLIKKIASVARRKLDPALKDKGASPVKLKRSYTKVADKAAVWVRDESQCRFVSPINGRRCTGRFGIQEDHVVPVALGGPSSVENLRLLCPAHNRFEAERIFGREKMDRYTQKTT